MHCNVSEKTFYIWHMVILIPISIIFRISLQNAFIWYPYHSMKRKIFNDLMKLGCKSNYQKSLVSCVFFWFFNIHQVCKEKAGTLKHLSFYRCLSSCKSSARKENDMSTIKLLFSRHSLPYVVWNKAFIMKGLAPKVCNNWQCFYWYFCKHSLRNNEVTFFK